jgi:hypothetical protein
MRVPDVCHGERRLPEELPEMMRRPCVAVGKKEGDRQVEANIAAVHTFQRWQLPPFEPLCGSKLNIWLVAESNTSAS